MAKVVHQWSEGSISIAVEAGVDDANRESVHVHVYKNGRRTEARVPGKTSYLDSRDADIAEKLFYDNYYEICRVYDEVKQGKYDR